MARFIVRSVSKGAGGRPITRERVYDASKISVGRHPGSEIHLPDLNVALYHAVMTAESDGRVSLDSPVVTIDPAVGGEVLYGDHRLQVSRGPDGEIVVDVANIAPAPPPPRDERKLFTLAGVAPGKRGMAWLFALLIVGAFVAWPVWSFMSPAKAQHPTGAMVADTAWSPGALSTPHAALETNCRACHNKSFTAVTDTSCRSCHADTHDHADPRRLMQARPDLPWTVRMRQAVATTFGRTPGRCVDCHQEHHGPQMVATAQQFCSDCHAAMKSKLPDTRIANVSDFSTGHPQFRAAVLQNPGATPTFTRVSLDANPQENTGLKFPHALHLSGSNAVAQMARRQGQVQAGTNGLDCADCHTPNSDGSFKPISMEQNCQSCHSLAFARSDGSVRTLRHGDPASVVGELRDFYAVHPPAPPVGLMGGRRRPGDFAAEMLRASYGSAVGRSAGQGDQAVRAVFQPGGACYDCHAVVAPTDGGLGYRIAPVSLPQRYMLKGWFDHRAHSTQTCASCHAANTSSNSRDLMLPKIAECRTCHAGENAHAGQLRSTCAMCHSYHMDPTATTAPDPKRRGIIAASGTPLVVRRPHE